MKIKTSRRLTGQFGVSILPSGDSIRAVPVLCAGSDPPIPLALGRPAKLPLIYIVACTAPLIASPSAGPCFSFQMRPLNDRCTMSASARITDSSRKSCHVRFVPSTEVANFHSTTSVAWTRSESGTLRPSAFAALRLMIRSNLVGCNTGRSAGFSPLRIRPT